MKYIHINFRRTKFIYSRKNQGKSVNHRKYDTHKNVNNADSFMDMKKIYKTIFLNFSKNNQLSSSILLL